jgi:hypothetical protein
MGKQSQSKSLGRDWLKQIVRDSYPDQGSLVLFNKSYATTPSDHEAVLPINRNPGGHIEQNIDFLGYKMIIEAIRRKKGDTLSRRR